MKKHYRTDTNCLNCGTMLQGKYCHHCGQENLEIKESFGHMMNHAVSDYFHFDHQFFHTLKPLLFKPGMLTNEYTAGRRMQYLHPIKMYIFISVVYFLLLFKTGSQETKQINAPAKPVDKQHVLDSVNRALAKNPTISAPQKKRIVNFQYYGKNYATTPHSKIINFDGDTTYKQYITNQAKLPVNKRDGFLSRKITGHMLKYYEKYGARTSEVFVDELEHNTPKMMFVLLPLLALIIGITFRYNKKFYVEHLIYSFHLYCFLFLFFGLIIIIEMIIPDSWGINDWIAVLAAIYTLWYLYKSLKVVYHRSAFRTITKIAGITVVYSVITSVCLVLLVLITALLAT